MRYVLAVLLIAAAVTLSAQGTPGTPFLIAAGPDSAPAPPWDAPHLQFDVASVKANKSGPNMIAMRTLPSNFNMTNVPLRMLIVQAYRVAQYQLVGAPGWIDAERFDIVAKAPEGSRPDQVPLMLRGLLAERFKLKLHVETRDTPVYALVLARSDGRLGPKLTKTTDDCQKVQAERAAAMKAARGSGQPGPFVPPPGLMPKPSERAICTVSMNAGPAAGGGLPVMTMRAGGQTIASLVRTLSSSLNRQVIDRTGLEGLYDYELQFGLGQQAGLSTQQPGGNAPTAPIDDGPTMFDAVRELGLKLESERGPVEHLVIDSVERPTED
jgi:uncharacterized protein (TIGR03435 family)